MRLLLALLLLASQGWCVTCTGDWKLENNATDSSATGAAGSVVGAPSFVTVNPVALDGTYSMYTANAANYVSATATTALELPASGTVACSFMPNGAARAIYRGLWCATYGANGRLALFIDPDGHLYVNFPRAGVPDAADTGKIIQTHVWYDTLLTWNSAAGTIALYVREAYSDNYYLWWSATGKTVAATGASTSFFIGVNKDADYPAYAWINRVSVFSTEHTSYPYLSELKNMWLFNVQGASNSRGGCVGDNDAFRLQASNSWYSAPGQNKYFAGGATGGTVFTPYDSAVGGNSTTAIAANLGATLDSYLPNTSAARAGCLVFFTEDCGAYNCETITTTYSDNLDSIISTCLTHNPNMKVFFATMPVGLSSLANYSDYADKTFERTAAAQALEQAVYHIDLRNNGSLELCDDKHLTAASQVIVGQALVDLIYGIDNPATTPLHRSPRLWLRPSLGGSR